MSESATPASHPGRAARTGLESAVANAAGNNPNPINHQLSGGYCNLPGWPATASADTNAAGAARVSDEQAPASAATAPKAISTRAAVAMRKSARISPEIHNNPAATSSSGISCSVDHSAGAHLRWGTFQQHEQ